MPTKATVAAHGKPLVAGIYVRISDDSAGKGLGVKRQADAGRQLLRRQGWKLHRVYEDNDISAFKGKVRPEYLRLLEDVKAGAVKVIVAWHPDRLHRSPTELEHFIDVVEAAHAQVATVQGGHYDLSTAAGRMTARIVGAVSRGESEHRSERLLLKHQELASNGKSAGGGRPFGYEADRRTLRARVVETRKVGRRTEKNTEAALVREAARRVLQGEAMRSVCRDWNARAIPTVGGAMGWSPQVLRRLLVSARISGRREYSYAGGKRLDIGRITAKAEWPAIIGEDDSDRMRQLLGGPNHKRRGQVREYLLTGGLARCGRCGEPLQAHPRADRRKEMACVSRPGTRGCGRLGILAEPVEAVISETVIRAAESGAFARALERGDDGEARAATQELLQVKAKQDELADMWTQGTINRDEWARARAGLQDREDRLRKLIERQRRPRALDDVPADLRKAWRALPLHRRRAFVETLIEAVVIRPAAPGRHGPPEDRVDITWRK